MRVAGIPKDACGPGATYQMVTRHLKREIEEKKKQQAQLPPRPPSQSTTASNTSTAIDNSAPLPEIQIEDASTAAPSTVVSPMSEATSSAFDHRSLEPEFEIFNAPACVRSEPGIAEAIFGDQYSVPIACASGSVNINYREARKKQATNINSNILHLTTSKGKRRTTQAAQAERQSIRELDNIRKSMYKTATVLYKSVTENENTLLIFKSADHVAKALNDLIGIDCLSGRELAQAVRNGNEGKSPPRLGRQGEVPLDHFKAFCNLVFTACSIEQANCAQRSNREELKSIVGSILNSKRESEGSDPMDDVRFYKRIEHEICHLQDLKKADTREALRVLWLTYLTQKKHYQNWEEAALHLGFARELNENERVEDVGHIVWKEHRLSHVLQFDEVNIALDGADDAIGGRESRIPTSRVPGMADSGQATQKSGDRMTIMFGVNFAGEALPPLFIFPTRATDKKNYRIKAEFLQRLPQLKAQYGYPEPRYHNIPFAVNSKGGMTAELLHAFFEQCIFPLYPNCADDDENRLLFKMDSGPGRMNPQMLASIRARGGHLHPGLPNGSGVGQELDQMFSETKGGTHDNRDKLWQARHQKEGDNAALSMGDISAMVFGGKVTLTDGSVVELENVFDRTMDNTHIHAAMDKCGYCPSTRAGLQSTQIRHEIIENEELRSTYVDLIISTLYNHSLTILIFLSMN